MSLPVPPRLLDPRHVAIVGLSDDPAKHGARVLAALRRLGYRGRISGVNPRMPSVADVEMSPRLEDLPEPPDVVVCAIPAGAVPGVVEEAGAAGAQAAVVFAGGFAEAGEEGRSAQDELTAAAERAGVAVLGPNSGGVIRPSVGLALSFLTCLERPPAQIRSGPVGLVTQSGGTGSYLHNLAAEQGGGLAVSVSTGNEAGIGLAGAVDAVGALDEVQVVALVLETVRDGARFIESIRTVGAAGKQVVACRLGRSDRGRRLMATHTGALAGPARVLDGVLDHLGVVVAETPGEMLDVAEVIARARVPAGGRTGVVTHSGGIAILLADLAERQGVELPAPGTGLSDELGPLLDHGAADNPLDMGGIIAGPERYARVVEAFAGSGDYDTVLAVSTAHPPAHSDGRVAALLALEPAVPVIHLWMAGDQATGGLVTLRGSGAPVTVEPRSAMRALAGLARLAELRTSPADPATPPGSSAGGAALTEHQAKRLVEGWGVPVVAGDLVASPQEAVAVAERIGYPVAVKASSIRLTHKTEAGAVQLDVPGPEAVVGAFHQVWAAALRSGAEPDGVLVERMRPGLEMILGAVHDASFGPVVVVGMGGVAAEATGDVAAAPAPVSAAGARRMIDRLSSRAALDVARGRPAADIVALARLVSTFGAAFVSSGLEEVEINPLVWTGDGWEALDALARPPAAPDGDDDETA